MALNLDSNEIFEFTRYLNVSDRDQHFYAVKYDNLYSIDSPEINIKRTLKTIFKSGFSIRDNMIGDSGERWLLIESQNGSIMESNDSSTVVPLTTWINWVRPTNIPERTVKFSYDSAMALADSTEPPTLTQEEIDSDWAAFVPDLNERDSLNSSSIQAILDEYGEKVALNPFYAVFLDSSGQHWDDDTQQWIAGPDPDLSE